MPARCSALAKICSLRKIFFKSSLFKFKQFFFAYFVSWANISKLLKTHIFAYLKTNAYFCIFWKKLTHIKKINAYFCIFSEKMRILAYLERKMYIFAYLGVKCIFWRKKVHIFASPSDVFLCAKMEGNECIHFDYNLYLFNLFPRHFGFKPETEYLPFNLIWTKMSAEVLLKLTFSGRWLRGLASFLFPMWCCVGETSKFLQNIH